MTLLQMHTVGVKLLHHPWFWLRQSKVQHISSLVLSAFTQFPDEHVRDITIFRTTTKTFGRLGKGERGEGDGMVGTRWTNKNNNKTQTNDPTTEIDRTDDDTLTFKDTWRRADIILWWKYLPEITKTCTIDFWQSPVTKSGKTRPNKSVHRSRDFLIFFNIRTTQCILLSSFAIFVVATLMVFARWNQTDG